MKISVFSRYRIKNLTYSAMFLSVALLLPQIFHQFKDLGRVLLPMHLPVLLAGFICGWPWGLAVGLVAPLLSSALFGMPVIFPAGVSMAFELAVYGAMTGLFYRLLPKKIPFIYITLLISMISGRLVSALVQFVISGFRNTEFSLSAFWSGTVIIALPGIIIQLILIPLLVLAIRRVGIKSN